PDAAAGDGGWLVIADQGSGPLGIELVQRLEAFGRGAELREFDSAQIEARAARGPCRGIAWLSGAPAGPENAAPDAALSRCSALLHVLAAVVQASWQGEAPAVWVVTRGAQSVGGEPPADLAGASLWGIGRVFSREHPALWGGLVDLDPAAARDADVA